MLKRIAGIVRNLFPSALGGVLGALTIWLIAARPQLGTWLHVSSGDVLQSISAFAAVALTIWATLWLENRRRVRSAMDDQRLLKDALQMLSAHLQFISQPLNPETPIGQRITHVAASYELLRAGRSAIAYAREGYRVRDYNLWNALQALDTDFATANAMLTREENIIRGGGVTEAVLAISRREVEHFAASLDAPVNAALAAMNHEAR